MSKRINFKFIKKGICHYITIIISITASGRIEIYAFFLNVQVQKMKKADTTKKAVIIS